MNRPRDAALVEYSSLKPELEPQKTAIRFKTVSFYQGLYLVKITKRVYIIGSFS